MPKIPYERVGEYVKTAFQVLIENDDSLRVRDILQQVGQRLDLNEYELETHDKSGNIRWRSMLHFYSINATKAGWLRKDGGVWYITSEGKEAAKLSNIDFYQLSHQKYIEWKTKQPQRDASAEEIEGLEDVPSNPQVTFDTAESAANEEIEVFVRTREAYEFQNLVAALLRGMGYHTPFVAPRGPDGGIDVSAYSDPLGTKAPRITVQVKQRPDTRVTVQEMRELSGLLRMDGDTGLFVSTGGFTRDALSEAKNAVRHIETIDLQRFIQLWKSHHKDMTEKDNTLLPLREIMFYAPPD